MTDVTLSAATTSALLLTQRTSALATLISDRIATGLRVTRAADDAAAFFSAQSLTSRAGDLLALKSGINQGVSALGGALAGLSAITDITNQLRGIAAAARGGSAESRAAAAAQFDALRGQIDSLAGDVSFNGINLISAQPGSLTVAFNETGTSSLTVPGAASDAASLGIGTAAGSFNNFATAADIDAAIAGLDKALGTLRSTASTLGSNASVLNIRLDFTQNLANTLQAGAGNLVNADLNEEAAKLLSLRLKTELSLIGQTIANDSQQAVLQLFEGST
jgi:flagellin